MFGISLKWKAVEGRKYILCELFILLIKHVLDMLSEVKILWYE